jgi:hypothetical protein
MKLKKKPILILLLTLFVFQMSFGLFASATEDETRGTVTATNLKFNFETGNDKIMREIGNVRFEKTTPLGYDDLGDGTYIFKANMQFRLEANIWSTYTKDEIFRNDASTMKSLVWADLITGRNPSSQMGVYQQLSLDYSDYSNIPTSASSVDNLAKGIDTDLTISATFSDMAFDDVDYGDGTAATTDFTAEVVQISIDNFVISDLQSGDNEYTSNVAAILADNEIEEEASTDREQVVIDAIDSLGLRGTPVQNAQTFQQGVVSSEQGLCNYNKFKVKLKPNVLVRSETMSYIYREIAIDTEDKFLQVSAGIYSGNCQGWGSGINNPVVDIFGAPAQGVPHTGSAVTKTATRTIGWEVKNYNLHYDFVVTVYVESFMAIDYSADADYNQLSEQGLAQFEDVIWFNLFEGIVDVTAPPLDIIDVSGLGTFAIFVIVAIVALAGGYFYLKVKTLNALKR